MNSDANNDFRPVSLSIVPEDPEAMETDDESDHWSDGDDDHFATTGGAGPSTTGGGAVRQQGGGLRERPLAEPGRARPRQVVATAGAAGAAVAGRREHR